MANSNGVVKEFRTSKFYGVRLDKRTNKDSTTIYYRTDICVENKKYYLGAYHYEHHAAYAFNVGFRFFSNDYYLIENVVQISSEDADAVRGRVIAILKKRLKIK